MTAGLASGVRIIAGFRDHNDVFRPDVQVDRFVFPPFDVPRRDISAPGVKVTAAALLDRNAGVC